MTMVSSGEISLGGSATSGGLNRSVNLELGRSATATISMNESAVRTLAGVPSGAISLNNFYGKSNQFNFTISSNQTNADLRTLAVNAGWNQASKVAATINSGVTIVSSSTGSPALTVSGSFPGGVDLINNGTILGRGGNGGNGSNAAGGGISGGGGGGLALSVSVAISINNGSGRIAGGGGGGGGGQRGFFNPGGKSPALTSPGSGGGGGIGNGPGGAAGSGGNTGAAQAGGTGTLTTAGNGGAATGYGKAGGAGGSWGAGGSAGGSDPNFGAGGAGGAAGAAVAGNSNITWIATGTRNGGIS